MKPANLLVCLLSALLVGCSSNSSDLSTNDINNTIKTNNVLKASNDSKAAKWTVMVYISGDNDLEQYVVKDIENELAPLGSTNNVQVVALADRIPGYDKSRGDWTSSKLFHITKGMKASPESAVADWGEKNFGDPKTLADFVTWSKTTYPADHYALYMWGHGWNWHPGFTMEDKTSKDALDPDEVKSVFPKLGFIDMIAYDGCDMGSVEVEDLWHNHATAIVHSQEYVGWDGIEYDVVLNKLNENPAMNADQLAIVTSKSASTNKEKTGSAVAIDNRFDNLLKAIDEWSVALTNGLDKNRAAYDKAFKATQHFWEAPDDKDLYDLASKVDQSVSDPVIKAKSKVLMNTIKSVVLDEWHASDYPNVHGISISKVSAKDEYKNYYKTLDFSKATKWNQFLDAYKN